MIDVFNIPSNSNSTQIFYGTVYNTNITVTSGVITGSWQTWQKPRGCRFIHIFCLGSGGGAGVGGYTAGGAFGLGRGGGSGAITKAIFPADVLPDTLYVLPGVAAPFLTGSNTGNGGLVLATGWPRHSIVAIRPITTWPDAMNVVCASGGTNNGGVTSNNLTVEDAVTEAYAGFLALANWTSNEGVAAGIGSVVWGDNTNNNATIVTAGQPNQLTFPNDNTQNGGSILSVDLGIMKTPLIAGGISSTTGDATDGQDGQWFWKPVMFGVGGAGGGNSTVGYGGRGGDGGYGCGGGAGGWGQLGQGRGGRGGDGLVIITAF